MCVGANLLTGGLSGDVDSAAKAPKKVVKMIKKVPAADAGVAPKGEAPKGPGTVMPKAAPPKKAPQ